MQRWKLTIEYDGTDFVGWQIQAIDFSVQQVLENAIVKFSGAHARLFAAGRTDSGVHALGMVAHVDLVKDYTAYDVRAAFNVHARPHAVSVLLAEKVAPDFHARFDAVRRRYRYVICNRRAPMAISKNYAWHVWHPLDIEAMQAAANNLIGLHDFSAFRAKTCQAASPVRSIDKMTVTQHGEMVHIDIEARSFLHHQVRNIVGTLKKIGEGKWPAAIMPEILASKDRARAGQMAPAQGLFFVGVDYNGSGSK